VLVAVLLFLLQVERQIEEAVQILFGKCIERQKILFLMVSLFFRQCRGARRAP